MPACIHSPTITAATSVRRPHELKIAPAREERRHQRCDMDVGRSRPIDGSFSARLLGELDSSRTRWPLGRCRR
jgi:hypothetical protein